MTTRQAENYTRLHTTLAMECFTGEEIDALIRIERTLQRWGERECGDDYGCIERDEETGKPYWLNSTTMRRTPIPDRETGAKRKLDKIMQAHPEWLAYHQADSRGCNLYLLKRCALAPGESIESVYTRGIAICY